MIMLPILIFWRLGLFIISFLIQRVPFVPSFPYSDVYFFPSGLHQWLWSWANFDGVHYLTIAKSGYMAQFTQAFFPLFPLIIRYTAKLFSDQWMIVTGLIVTNLLFLLAIIYLKKLLLFDYKSSIINWMLIFLLFFPTSFYFVGLYTESLFFILVLFSFYFARQKKWWLSGIFGGLASLTKITGIFLLPAILWEWHIANLKFKNQNLKLNLYSIISILRSPILYLIPTGLISYMIYLQVKFGDWLYFWHAQSVFGAQRSSAFIILLPQVLWRYFKMLINYQSINYQYWIAFLEISSFLLCIGLLIFAHFKKVRLSYLIFSWFMIIVPSLTGTLSSIPRYILLAFPMYISLALINNRYIKLLILCLFVVLQILLAGLFLQGKWVA